MSTILIVEDEPRISTFIAKGLKAAGFASTATTSGIEAVTMAVHGDFDLVVDIQMIMAYFTQCGLIQVDGDKNAELLQAKAMIESECQRQGRSHHALPS